MHSVRPVLALAAVAAALVVAGCGQTSAGSSGPTGSTPRPTGAVAGVLVSHDSAHPGGGTPVAGVTIGLYTRAITTAGPVMLNPPKPVMTTVTDARGAFSFTPAGARARWFVAPIGASGYAPGRWVALGGDARIDVCTDCPMPL
jgi:hypothetical protein